MEVIMNLCMTILLPCSGHKLSNDWSYELDVSENHVSMDLNFKISFRGISDFAFSQAIFVLSLFWNVPKAREIWLGTMGPYESQ